MLRTRLYLGLLPLLLLFILVSGVTTLLYRNLAVSLEQDLAANYRAMIGGYEMRDAVSSMASALTMVGSANSETARRDYAYHRARFQKQFMEQSLVSAGKARTLHLEKLDDGFTQFDTTAQARIDVGSGTSLERLRETETLVFRMLATLEELTQSDYAEVQDAAGEAARIARVSINVLISATVGAVLLSLFLSYRLAGALLRPIQALNDSVAALGEGRLEHDVPVTRDDELGELARSFNAMADKLRAYRDAMTQRVTRARRTMEATLTSTPDPLFVINADGTHEVRNPAAEAIAALPEFADGLPSELREPLREVVASGAHYLPTDYEHVVTIHVDGGERHYLPRILAIGDTLTGFGGAAVILQDVTKFRLLDDVKGNLVSTVSHELKTPLTSMLMAVHVLLDESFGAINARQRDLLVTARENSERLLRILNDLLDLSRLEGGASSLNRRPVAVAALLADMAAEMQSIVAASDQTIQVQADSALTTVDVDADRVRHVFINLLTNASKYSGEGSVITLYARPAPDGFVRFGVRDQGPGIAADYTPHIFDRFYRVPDQRRKGAGLGLTIAREIVVAHGGSIACASRLGEGSDFYFFLQET